jgi:putative endonuclease
MPHMYILKCADGSFYTGSTLSLDKRLLEHENGMGSNHTSKRLPVELVYCEEYDSVEDAFYREKQVQGWSRVKKMALIKENYKKLPELSRNYTQFGSLASTSSATAIGSATQDGVVEPVETKELATGFDSKK